MGMLNRADKRAFFLVVLLTVGSPVARAVPLNVEEQKILERGEISTTRYVVGGIAGSIYGLGIGHAIEGRYLEKGWIFTAAESLGAGLAVGGLAMSLSNCSDPYLGLSFLQQCESNPSAIAMFSAGVAIVAGFRVWEIVDLWTTPLEYNSEYRKVKARSEEGSAWMIAPFKDGAAVSFLLRL
jgi:hypothetical protein